MPVGLDDDEALIARWQAEEREQPTGWSFADLEGRMHSEEPPWDFADICLSALAGVDRMLDMGTGGGETLIALREAALDRRLRWPPEVVATEGWEPNIEVARAALAPYGIDVVPFGQPDDDPDPAPMPFPDGAFQLVVNRHESFHPAEIARVLAPGGVFCTQQVGGDELAEVRDLLGHPAPAPQVTYEVQRAGLRRAGLEIVDGAEHVGRYTFTDVAALVAYAQRVPWDFPEDFTVAAYAEPLLALHRRTGGGPVTATSKRFWLAARRR